MKKVVVAAVVLMALASGQADANPRGDGLTTKTAVFDTRTGDAIPAVTRLHPVIGSVNRTSHLNNPLSHRAKYSGTFFNPLLGSFGTKTFKR